jgi:hypothetical protein
MATYQIERLPALNNGSGPVSLPSSAPERGADSRMERGELMADRMESENEQALHVPHRWLAVTVAAAVLAVCSASAGLAAPLSQPPAGATAGDDVSSDLAAPGSSGLKPRDAATGLDIVGATEWILDDLAHPTTIEAQIGAIVNNRSSGATGNLVLAMWATPTLPAFGDTTASPQVHSLGSVNLGTLKAGKELGSVDTGAMRLTAPPPGCYYITYALLENHNGTYTLEDFRISSLSNGDNFGNPAPTGYVLFPFGVANCAQTAPCANSNVSSCLLGGRFQATVVYNYANGFGQGQVMSFNGQRAANDESVFSYFTDPGNFEMGLKMLDGCALNNHFWVFIGGLTTDQWTVNILDTATGNAWSSRNELNHLTSTVADTSAFPCP